MTTSPEDAIREYIKSLTTLDVESLLPYYDTPLCFVTSGYTVPIPDADQLRAVLSAHVDQMKSEGFQRTDVVEMRSLELASNLAQVTSLVARINTSDEEITRFRSVHTVRLEDERWKIVAVAVGDRPEADWTL